MNQPTWFLLAIGGVWIWLPFLHAVELVVEPVCEENPYSPRGLDKGILSWMHSLPGGYYNPKQEFRHSDPNDPSTLSGIFAREPIEEGELLCRVPWKYLVTNPSGRIEDEQLDCGMTRELARQLKLGKKSKFGPYVEYLNAQPEHQLPSAWSPQGQELLLQVLGQSREENSAILSDSEYASVDFPPLRMVAWMEEWYDRCHGNPNDTWGKKAALMALLRADDFMMIPAYDFYNHRNGEWHNADSEWEYGEYHETRASRSIEAGEQIYISYDRCPICSGRSEGYGTAEILRDYGFVEAFPQRWHYYHFNEIEFELIERDGHYQVNWQKQPRSKYINTYIRWLRQQIIRLTRLAHYESDNQSDIPAHEWEMTWAFHRANVVAMKSAIQALEGKNQSIVEETMTTMEDWYRDLEEDNMWQTADLESLDCDMSEFDPYRPIDGASSLYQTIQIHSLNDDVCLDHNQYVHVCSSFRPAYYEYFVHPAMSYLDTIRRVLIMGDAASFLLHEVLKYDIEYVMVLELDQTAIHMTQKHFGIDPHLGDPRVEWWFSEPGEVLSLLDTWGSFDLVLIDLPDSMLPSIFRNGKDLCDLVQDNGIVVSKGSEMGRLSKSFAFTSRLAYKLTPGCSQILTLGSHSMDFAQASVVDHNVETFLYQASLMKENRYQLLHDFNSDFMKPEPDLQSQDDVFSPLGVIQMLEFVDVTVNLEETIENSLTEHGFQVLSTMMLSSSFFWKINDGYIIARRSNSYIGLDIHLAKNISKLSALATSIASKLGSVLSTYRLVTNGKEETDQQIAQPRQLTPPNLSLGDDSTATGDVLVDVLNEIKTTILPSSKNGLLFCESSEDCLNSVLIRDLNLVETLFVFEMPRIQPNSTIDDGLLASMISNERNLHEWMQRTLIEGGVLVDSIFFDSKLSLHSLQLLDSVLDEHAHESWISDQGLLIMLPTPLNNNKARRFVSNQFLRTREDVDNNSRLNSSSSKVEYLISCPNERHQRMEFSLVAWGKKDAKVAFEELRTKLSDKLRKSELLIRISQLQGGLLESAVLLPARGFQNSDYKISTDVDMKTPTGAQVIIQINAKTGDVVGSQDTIAADISTVLRKKNLSLIQTSFVDDDTILFDLDGGDLVVMIHDSTAMDLNLFLPCAEDDCSLRHLYGIVIQLNILRPEWEVVSLDTLARGTEKSFGFAKYPFVRNGLRGLFNQGTKDNEEVDDEDDDDDDE